MCSVAMQDPTAKAPPSPPPRPGRQYVLRFISGKYQGGEFPLVPDKTVFVGRSSDLDMVLVEDMVSRKHAGIHVQGEQVWIEDLGSTNGTFVNGEKIKRARLKEGDRVLIGTSILKLVATDASSAREPTTDARQELESVAARRRTSQARTMSGSIEEVPLPDLLQLFGTSKKSGVLVIRTEGNDTGKIYLKKGNIFFASINDLDDVPPLKSIYRLLTWEKGLFDLDPADEREFPNAVDVTVPEILMEGLRQLDEFNRIRPNLPPMTARVRVTTPLITPLRNLSPEELDLLQVAHNYGQLETIFNKGPGTDLDCATKLLKLINGKYLFAEP